MVARKQIIKQMGIRITESQREELEKLAATHGVEVSQLIRWGIDAMLDHVKKQGNRLHLPIRLDEEWKPGRPKGKK